MNTGNGVVIRPMNFSIGTAGFTHQLTVNDAAALISSMRFEAGRSWYMVERPEEFQCGDICCISDDWIRHLQYLVIFDPEFELRLEAAGEQIRLRLILDGEAEVLRSCALPDELADSLRKGTRQGWCRLTAYYLRRHQTLRGIPAGHRLLYAEYFTEDAKSGLPLLYADRLYGFIGRGEKK